MYINMKIPKTVRQNEASMLFWTKKEEAGI